MKLTATNTGATTVTNTVTKFSVTAVMLLSLSGCASFSLPSFSLPFLDLEPEGPPVIVEPSLDSIVIEPVNLPSTKMPRASLEQAKQSYLSLLSTTKSVSLQAESLQRLAEIESMIAENSLQSDDETEFKAHLRLAANYYQRLIDSHSDKVELSKIQYQLARVKELEGESESAQIILSDLAKLSGNDFEVIEARFRMAENAYSTKNYTVALSLYTQVLEHKNDPSKGKLNSFYNTALFKRGWTNFKKVNYDLAVEDFIDLLDIIYVAPDNRSNAVNNLIKETLRVSALSLSYMDGAKELADYFSRRGHREFEAELYLSLADLYRQQQRFQDTANTYFAFVKSNTLHIDAPKFEHKGIEVLAQSGFVDLVLGSKENFVEHYKTGADYWQKTGYTRSEDVSRWLFKNLDDVINYYHAQAQTSKKVNDYLVAAKWYRVFLSSFSEHDKVSDKRWLLAEALFDAGDNKGSIQEYMILAYQPNNLTTDRKEEAAFRVILGQQKLFRDHEKSIANTKSASEDSLEKLTLARNELINAGIRYIDVFSQAKRMPLVLSETIELQLSDGQTAAAVALARTMKMVTWSTQQQQKRAREIIADGEFDLKNYPAAEQAYALIFKLDKYPQNKMTLFHERRAQAIYQQAELFKQQENFTAAIEQYLRLTEVEPKSKVRLNAQFDAATLLLQIKNYNQAIVVLIGFSKDYPKHQLTKSIPAKLIIAYEALENWQGAAKQYEYVASQSDDVVLKRTATWQAAISWMKLSDEKSKNTAVALWKKYIKAFPQPYDLSLEARNHLINLYGDLKVKWKQDFWRRKIILTVDIHKLKEPRARSLAAQSQMSLINDIFVSYEAIRLTLPLKRSLGKKRKLLSQVLKGYSKALDYQIQGASNEAGNRIGRAYALLAKSIFDSERPKGMSGIELEEYELLLEERIFPIEDQAIDAFEANVSLTQKGFWDQWIKNSFSQLEQLLPARYKKPEVIDDYATTP